MKGLIRQQKAARIKNIKDSFIYSNLLPQTALVDLAGEETMYIKDLDNYETLKKSISDFIIQNNKWF